MNKRTTFYDPQLLDQHYSTRLYKGYLQYLEQKLGLPKAKELIKQTGLSWEYLTNEQNWVSETFADIFYDLISKQIDLDPNHSFLVHKLAISRENMSMAHSVIIRHFDPVLVYKQIVYITRTINKVDSVTIDTFGKNSMNFTYRARRVTKHLPTILEGWNAILSYIPKLLDLPPAKVKIQITDERTAKINVEWKPAKKLIFLNSLKTFSSLTIGLSSVAIVLAAAKVITFLPFFYYVTTLLLSVIFFLLANNWRRSHLDFLTEDTKEHYESMVTRLEESYNELFIHKQKLDRRYQEANLLRSVIKRISLSLDPTKLIGTTLTELKQRLNYDKVLFFRYEASQNRLQFVAVQKCPPNIEKMLTDYTIDLSKSDAFLVEPFTKQTLLRVSMNEQKNGEQATVLFGLLGASHLVTAPVSLGKEKFGLLVVTQANAPFTEDDEHLIGNVANQLAISLSNAQRLEHERTLRLQFQEYVPKQVVESILGESIHDFGKGVKKRVTILFSDLRDFTSHSDKIPPETLARAVDFFFKETVQLIYRYGGMVDKFLGDGFLAYFNALEDTQNHELNAVDAAYQMQKGMKELNEALQKEVFKNEPFFPLYTRIAIHVGPIILFTPGSKQKREFTGIGKPINVASRLLGIAKEHGGNAIIISHDIKKEIEHNYLVENLGLQKVRGIAEKQQVYLVKGQKLLDHSLPNDKKGPQKVTPFPKKTRYKKSA